MLVMLLALLLGLGQAAPLPPAPLNADFEAVTAAGAPAGWIFDDRFKAAGFELASVPGKSGRGARLHGPAAASGYASLYQNIDAAPYRGKRVRYRASVRVARPGSFVGLALSVLRPEPKHAGFADAMNDRPIGAGDWTSYEIIGRVAPDAVRLWISLGVSGDADVTIDDVSLEVVPPDPTPPSKEAQAYLDEAIRLIRTIHIDSAHADWDRIAADARADIAGAKTPRDTYPAIRGVLGALGEKHSFLRPASKQAPAQPQAAGAPAPSPDLPLPTSELIDGRFALVRVPPLSPFAGGEGFGDRYQETLRTHVQALDKAPLCGWIVDLRGNSGGNMWPMMRGLDPLLGQAPFGFFAKPSGEIENWQRRFGIVVPAAEPVTGDPPAFVLTHAAAPVAVLVGPETASTGEMMAVAFAGRPASRSFGAPTAGYTTGNSVHDLPDGAKLVLTGVFVRDRTGKSYDGAIVPDETTGADAAQGRAVEWLKGMCHG